MDPTEVIYIKNTNLLLDPENPRIGEYGINKNSDQDEILQVLWDEMAVNELIYSIVSNGFWDYEPLVAVKNDSGKYVVIEGNRRLAAVLLIQDSSRIECTIPAEIREKISDDILNDTTELPVIVVDNRKTSWKYVGFKHVNGPAKWGSYAKAKYIADIHNNYNIPLSAIATQIGDTHNTAQKLYQGLMVLQEAEELEVFNRENIQAPRLYFSHLYTGLQREGIRNFLDLKDAQEEEKHPVPDGKKEDLGNFLIWLYGSSIDGIQPVIQSQNPDLKYLDEVLKDHEALSALRDGEPLHMAYEISRPDSSIFEENLNKASRSLKKAKSLSTTGYSGQERLLKVAGAIANMADDLYNEMFSKYEQKGKRETKERLSD